MHNELFFWDRVLSLFDWWHRPAYRIVGPSADREYLYREGDRHVFICFDYVYGSDIDQVIYATGIDRWEPPYDHEPIPAEKRSEIMQRLGKNLTSGKSRYEIR